MEHIKVILKNHTLWITLIDKNLIRGNLTNKGGSKGARDSKVIDFIESPPFPLKGRPRTKQRKVIL